MGNTEYSTKAVTPSQQILILRIKNRLERDYTDTLGMIRWRYRATGVYFTAEWTGKSKGGEGWNI